MDNSSASPKMVRLKEFGAWSEQTSSSGKRYYYNRESEVSQWEKPAEWKEHEKSLAVKQGTTKQSKSSSSTATKPPTAQQQKPESTKTSTTAQHASSDLPISSTVHTIPTTMLNTTTVSSRHNTSSTTTKVPTSSSTPITSGPPQQSSQHSSQNRSGGGVKRPREEERRDQHHQHRSSQPQQHNTPTPTSGSKYGESGGSHPVPEKISRTSASYEHSGSRTSKGQEKVGSSTTAGGTPQSEHLRPQFTSMPQSLPIPRNTSSPYSTPKFSGTTYTTPTTAAIISSSNENQHLQQRSSFNAATTYSFTPIEFTITVTESSFTPIRNTTAQMPPVSAPPPVPSRPQSSTPQPMDVAPAKNLGVVADRNSSAQRESEVPQVEKKEEGEEQGVEVPAFREERYMRFYKPELTAHRRNWTSEAYANEAKKYAERNSKQSVNLASIDNDINSVRSLLKTAEVRCLMLNQKLSFVREQISGLEARNHAI